MAEYFILYFKNDSDSKPVLKKWLLEEGQMIKPNEALISWTDGDQENEFPCPVPGLFKVHLFKEGNTLYSGCELAILNLEESVARSAEQQGLGKIIRPEELDRTIAHAGAASIRLPPEA